MMANPDVDVIVWAARGHANAIRHPKMFGWIDTDTNGLINRISVKEGLGQPISDPIVIGTFTFKRANDFKLAVEKLFSRDGRVNGEFYLDSCINDAIALGLKCYLFEVDHFLSWGTPNDLRTFEYWQSCFDKWPSHPYKLNLDSRVPENSIAELRHKYRSIEPKPSGVVNVFASKAK